MKNQKFVHLLGKAFAVATFASLSVVVNIPNYAESFATPKTSSTTTSGTVVSQANHGNSTIVDIAASDSNFQTLVAAVKAADLVETLSGDGPFTVFAPTNEAFAALPKGTLDKLLKPENKETLQKILTYHVVSGAVESGDLKSGDVDTVEGSSVKVQVKDNGIKVNKSKVIKADIKGSNGIIHVIDKVLLPADLK